MADANDKIFSDVTERQLQLLRVEAQLRLEILTELRKLERSIVARLTEEDSFTQKRLRILLNDVRDFIKEAYAVISAKSLDDMIELASIESAAMAKSLVNVQVATAAPLAVEKIRRLMEGALISGAPSEEWWQRQDDELRRAFSDNMREGVLLGETNDQLVRRVRGTKDLGYTNGIMQTARNKAEALVRTSVQTAANTARFETMEGVGNLIASYQHVSTLDSRTTPICVVRDGMRWDAKSKKPLKHSLPFKMPPLHWNCRSTLISNIKGVDLPDDATRASEDGQVSVKTTFEGFLKSKPKEFVEEVLGKGKAELYLGGKIGLRDLLDQSGNPLTLAELKRKYN